MAYPFYPNYPNYGNYYPQGYQPINQQPMAQPQPVQPAQQSFSPAINQSGIIWISGLQEAQMYPVGPNAAVALWEKSGKTIYLKQADATGRPMLTVYDLVERHEAVQDNGAGPDGKTSDYATKDDLGKVVGVVKSIDEVITSMKSDIDSMKSDMYGIAGKKKPAKKVEAEEDV